MDKSKGVWVITKDGDLVLAIRCSIEYSHDQRIDNKVVLHTPSGEKVAVQYSGAYSQYSSPLPKENVKLIAYRDAVIKEMLSAIQKGRTADLRNIPENRSL